MDNKSAILKNNYIIADQNVTSAVNRRAWLAHQMVNAITEEDFYYFMDQVQVQEREITQLGGIAMQARAEYALATL